jgi:hypothetical protein
MRLHFSARSPIPQAVEERQVAARILSFSAQVSSSTAFSLTKSVFSW